MENISQNHDNNSQSFNNIDNATNNANTNDQNHSIRKTNILNRFQKGKYNISMLLERVMAFIVFIAIMVAIFSLWEPFREFLYHRNESGAFLEFLGMVFGIVIGIEFFKLLCNPGKDTMLEVLMFVIARHMIIETTSTTENLISIISITILFVIDRFLLDGKRKFE